MLILFHSLLLGLRAFTFIIIQRETDHFAAHNHLLMYNIGASFISTQESSDWGVATLTV
jgi:hypothetical protein